MSFDFGDLDAFLSRMHQIDDRSRTKFQSRLKNLHRHGWPIGMESSQGKASRYVAHQILDMALAVEALQLGMLPERLVKVLCENRWPILMAYRMAASSMADRLAKAKVKGRTSDEWIEDLRNGAMFLYFDPCALEPLTKKDKIDTGYGEDAASATFFYGGIGVVRDNLAIWTAAMRLRISLINVTSLVERVLYLAGKPVSDEDIDELISVARFIEAWADRAIEQYEDGSEAEERYVIAYLDMHPIGSGADLSTRTGIPPERAERYYWDWYNQMMAARGTQDGKRS